MARTSEADTHSVWRAFDDNEVTHSVVHHLMAVSTLLSELGYARITDVADLLGITRGSVAATFKNLENGGLIERDKNGFLRLTERGEEIAESTRAKRFIFSRFLQKVLGLDKESALVDACKIEHLVSSDAANRLYTLLQFLDSGKPETEEFMQSLRVFLDAASHDVDGCPVCTDRCFLEN